MALADIPTSLIESCRAGDRDATEDLLRAISPDMYRIIYSMLRDHDDTDEVVQETLVRIFRHVAQLKEVDRFPSWAMRIAVNQVQTWRMKRNRQRTYELDESMETEGGVVMLSGNQGGTPREEAVRGEMREQIKQAMSGLPNRQQTAVVLFELEGCSIKEIAAAMSCSEGAVKFNIHEARKKLKLKLAHLMAGFTGAKVERKRAVGE